MPQDASYRHLHACPSAESALATLAGPTRAWFAATFGTPTAAQRFAWPTVAAGDNLLLCAPTGSGKTLAAFLPILDRLAIDAGLQCLYVAPLKALGQDVRKNLRGHERGLRGEGDTPRFRVGLRTGDTSQRVRRQQLAQPPHVLLTTPESLALLLTRGDAGPFLRGLRWVIVDEVHALADSKRGADLALSLERLETLATARLQRIGLSATCTPLDEAAAFLVGVGRPCRIAQIEDRAPLSIVVEALPGDAGFVPRLLDRLDAELHAQSTTLIFANTRHLTERLTWALRRRYPERADAIAAHHSALSTARRRQVERRLKHGLLWVAVSSTSLELGIDIGSVDGVVFVHPPGGAVRLLQRLGRSGHRPDQPRRGLVLVATVGDLLEATVTAASSRQTQLEPLRGIARPLDVLCQHLVGLAMTGTHDPAEVLTQVRRAWPYRHLDAEEFRDALDYLAGRRRDGTDWLPARLRWRDGRFTVVDTGTARLLRRNLGSIVGETSCVVRLRRADEESAVVGEVDQFYADQLQVGERFLLDGRCLELKERDRDGLLVEEVLGRPLAPRWLGGGAEMPAEIARRLVLFRLQAAETLRDGDAALLHLLRDDFGLGAEAARAILHLIAAQEMTSEVPDLGTLLIECVPMQACTEYFVHTPLPRRLNETLARLVALRWRRHRGGDPVTLAANLGFVVSTEPGPADPALWRGLLALDDLDADLRRTLHDSNDLSATFGRVAQVGLMVLRQGLGRKPNVGGRDWAERELFAQLQTDAPDFVLLRQAEREAAAEAGHGDALGAYVRHIARADLRLRTLRQPSPFGEGLLHLPWHGNERHAAATSAEGMP